MRAGGRAVNDDRTPEQREADKLLADAIQRCSRAYELPEDAVIVNYVVVGSAIRSDGTADLYHDFTLLRDNGQGLPDHVLVGMLDLALDRARFDYRRPDGS